MESLRTIGLLNVSDGVKNRLFAGVGVLAGVGARDRGPTGGSDKMMRVRGCSNRLPASCNRVRATASAMKGAELTIFNTVAIL
jgi:hypothetical protein